MRIDIHHAKPITGGFGLRIRDTEREGKAETSKNGRMKFNFELQSFSYSISTFRKSGRCGVCIDLPTKISTSWSD